MHTNNITLLDEVKKQVPSSDEASQLTEFFKAIGNSTRSRILLVLLELNELCQYEICYLLDMEKSAISHQMKILIENRLVKARKSGKEVFYQLHDEHVVSLLTTTKEHLYGKENEKTKNE